VGKEKFRWQEKLMADILNNFSKSRRKAAEEIFSNNVLPFGNFYFKYKEHIRMFWHNSILKIGRTFWPDWLTCALTWQH
jgi:hypothetical protein